MLSVFITPCTKPTRIQCAIITAVRTHTSPNHVAYSCSPSPSSSGKSRRMQNSSSCRNSSRSPRE